MKKLRQKQKKYMVDMLSDISHQIKTPMTAITLMTELLSAPELTDEERMDYVEKIQKQTNRITWLVRNLLTLSQLEADMLELKKEELNVKEVVFTDDVRDFTSYTFKPQLRTVGPKYGKQLGGIRAQLSAINGQQAMQELRSTGQLVLTVDGEDCVLKEEDLLIEAAQMADYVSDSERELTVVLSTVLSPELIREGVTGLLFDAGDVDTFAAHLCRFRLRLLYPPLRRYGDDHPAL